MNGLIRKPFWVLPSFLEETEEGLEPTTTISGLSVSEDEKSLYVEAAVPGLEAKDLDITFDKGLLRIQGEKVEEKKEKKYYRKATSSFAYEVMVPGDVDLGKEPQAEVKAGIAKITFSKSEKTLPKKIRVKTQEG